MSAYALTAAQIENLKRSLDGSGMSVEHAEAMLTHILVTMPAQVLANLGKVITATKDATTLKAIDVTTLADKAVVIVEDTLQWFEYDADSAAAEALGPPATVVQPTAGAGRYIALTLGGSGATKAYVDTQDGVTQAAALASLDSRLRAAADAAAVKAIDVATLADKALVYVEDLRQLYAYDSASVLTDEAGVSIEPTAGAGAYLALTDPPSAFTWFATEQATDPGAGDNLPAGADGTFANSNGVRRRAPVNGHVSVWYIGEATPVGVDDANTAVFKVIKLDNSALLTKTYDTANQPGAAFVPTLLGTLAVTAGDMLGWECITGATADLPKFTLQFDLTPTV